MAAWHLLGDKRLTNEIHVVNGIAYLRDERMGPPARWAAAPTKLESHDRQRG